MCIFGRVVTVGGRWDCIEVGRWWNMIWLVNGCCVRIRVGVGIGVGHIV